MFDPHGDALHGPPQPVPAVRPVAPTAAPRASALGPGAVDPELTPILDTDGLLRHDGRWVPIPDTQLVVVELLVRNLGRLVGNAEVRSAYLQAGGSGTATSLRSLVHRLGRRVAAVGLHLHVVRSRGLVLDVPRP